VDVTFKKDDSGSDHITENEGVYALGEGRRLSHYPLQTGWTEDMNMDGGGLWRTSYDGSVLRLTSTDSDPYAGKAATTTRSFDIFTDSNGAKTTRLIFNQYDGEGLNPSHQKGKLVCGEMPMA